MRNAAIALAALFAVALLAPPAFADCAGHQQTVKSDVPMTPAPSTTQAGVEKDTATADQPKADEKKS